MPYYILSFTEKRNEIKLLADIFLQAPRGMNIAQLISLTAEILIIKVRGTVKTTAFEKVRPKKRDELPDAILLDLMN